MFAFELQLNLETFSHPGQIGILEKGRKQMHVRMWGEGRTVLWMVGMPISVTIVKDKESLKR